MASFFNQLTAEQIDALLPKVKVALALYRHHNSLLATQGVREQIEQIDRDVGELLSLIYDKKRMSRQELTRWVTLQEQNQENIAVQVTTPERYPTSGVGAEQTTVSARTDIGLVAKGKGKIYKRTLPQDIEKLLR